MRFSRMDESDRPAGQELEECTKGLIGFGKEGSGRSYLAQHPYQNPAIWG